MPLPMVNLLGEAALPAVIDLRSDSPPPAAGEAGAKRRRPAAQMGSGSALAHLECPICLQSYAEPPPQSAKGGASAAASSSTAVAAGSGAAAKIAAAAKGAAASVVATLCGHHAHAVCAATWLAKCPASKPTCFKCTQPLAPPVVHPLYLV